MRQRRVLQMSHDELRAVTAIVLPGRKGDELRVGEMQEMCIKWLFANGLSINHVFEIHDDDGDLFCVMRNSEACWCCPKASETGTLTEFDRGPIGENYKRTPSPTRRPKFDLPSPDLPPSPQPPKVQKPPVPTSKVTPITVQPTIVTIPDKPRKHDDEEEKKKTCGYCKRECGLCIVNLCSQC